MTDFTDVVDGFTYRAEWSRTSVGRIKWIATVRNSQGDLCGLPKGEFSQQDLTDVQCQQAVQMHVEAAITFGSSVDRGGR